MNQPVDSKEQKTAYERWEMASFGGTEGDRRMRRDDQVVNEKAAKVYDEATKSGYSKGYTKGMQDGFAVGMDNAKQQINDDRQTLKNIALQFNHALESADESIADDVLALALDIAQAMIKNTIKHDPQAILPIVMDSIHYLPHIEKPARLILHHDDAKVVREHLGDELINEGWVIQEESHIEQGGCLVETGANQIDATNHVRWKRISEAFSKKVDWKR